MESAYAPKDSRSGSSLMSNESFRHTVTWANARSDDYQLAGQDEEERNDADLHKIAVKSVQLTPLFLLLLARVSQRRTLWSCAWGTGSMSRATNTALVSECIHYLRVIFVDGSSHLNEKYALISVHPWCEPIVGHPL